MSKTLPFILLLATLASAIEMHMSAPSLPDISDYFGISDGMTQLTISINLIGYCLACVFVGPLSDSYGRRTVLITGSVIMLIGAIGCVCANSIEFLLFSRFLQGIGASTPVVIVNAIIADLYKGPKAAKLIGQVMGLLTICSAIAPVAGGVVQEMVGWRGNYAVVAIFSFLSLVVVIAKLPETKVTFDKFKIVQISRNYWTILSNDVFVCGACVPILCYTGFISFIVVAPFLYTETFKLTLMHYVFHQGVIILSFSVSSMFVGTFIKLVGEINSTIWGTRICLLATIFMVLLSLFSDNSVTSAYLTTASMIIFATGCSSCRNIILAKTMEIYPEHKGQASSVIAGLRMFLASISISITSYFYDGSLFVVAMTIFLSSVLMLLLNLRFLKKSSFGEEQVVE